MNRHDSGWVGPIDATNAADVFDALLHPDDRVAGCLAFLFLDGEGNIVMPLVIEEPPQDTTRRTRDAAMQRLFEQMRSGPTQVAFARARGGTLLLRDEDREWHELVMEGSRRADLTLIGAWLATEAGLRSFPGPLAEAIPA